MTMGWTAGKFIDKLRDRMVRQAHDPSFRDLSRDRVLRLVQRQGGSTKQDRSFHYTDHGHRKRACREA